MSRPTLAQMVGLHMAGLDALVEARSYPPMPPDRPVFHEKEHPPLGFGPASVVAGCTACFNEQIMFGIFRPYRLIVPSSICDFFTIEDIKVGRNSHLPRPLPASVFSQDSLDPGIEFDVAQVGQIVSVLARNDGHGPLMFSACLLGAEAGRRGPSSVRVPRQRDPIRLCDYCGAPPKRGHATDACYYCQRKR